MFDTIDDRGGPAPLPEERAVATLTHRYWVNFVKTGRPDGPDTPPWPRATASDTTVQLIDTAGASHVEHPYTARLDFTAAHPAH